ncbi:adenylate kinase-domain-containing protein [Baffinella frigidus]|nr:adenylate kinase-domain-containing protein [Cryptophyta sp. CCMP2293]
MSGEKPRIIIAGAPASGKGTQCELIVEKFGVVHISTGDALRAQVKAETELGMKAKEFMESGGLVPDELIIGIVKARLAEEDCQTQGWLLDGFPRTGVQAEAMIAAGIHATHFVLLEVPDEILVERCVGRRSDPDTGKIYHLKFHPPPEDDEALIARLVHRADDTEEAMGNRIKSYHENVKAVTPFYESLMQTFDGQTDKTEIASKVAEFLSAPVSSAPVSSAPVPPGGPLGIIIAGAPASGKGTQCELIVEKFGVVHISTGDALRAQVKAETELGMKAKEFMESGGLVPDDLIIGIVKARLAEDDCKTKGWLLDGFPRTGVQAEAMIGAGIHATHFVLLEVPDDILVERCVGRRSDPDTGKIYHLKFHPPPEDDAELMARLVHRADDTAEAMGNRIKSYHENVKAVTPFYERLMQTFDGQAEKTGIADKVAAFLGTTPSSSGGASGGASRGGTSGGERGGGAVPRILMAGAQGSGKLTQSKMLEEQFGCVHIKSAELLRACVEEQTPLGAQMREVNAQP